MNRFAVAFRLSSASRGRFSEDPRALPTTASAVWLFRGGGLLRGFDGARRRALWRSPRRKRSRRRRSAQKYIFSDRQQIQSTRGRRHASWLAPDCGGEAKQTASANSTAKEFIRTFGKCANSLSLQKKPQGNEQTSARRASEGGEKKAHPRNGERKAGSGGRVTGKKQRKRSAKGRTKKGK